MTEAEWLDCNDPATLLFQLQGTISARKLRLFACACARRYWHLMSDARSREAIEASERFADDPTSVQDLIHAERVAAEWCQSAWEAHSRAGADYELHFLDDAPDGGSDPSGEDGYHAYAALVAASDAAQLAHLVRRTAAYRLHVPHVVDLLSIARRLAVTVGVSQEDEKAAQCRLLREVVACPYRRVRMNPVWRYWEYGVVWDLAWGVYEEGAFDRLPILGDALEEAGCSDESILSHLRSAGPHVRGCWALDLVLGNE